MFIASDMVILRLDGKSEESGSDAEEKIKVWCGSRHGGNSGSWQKCQPVGYQRRKHDATVSAVKWDEFPRNGFFYKG
jgi:hypothetical protein